MRRSLEPGTRRLVSAANYTEVLIGPLRAAGPAGAEQVDAMRVHLGIDTIRVDMALARRAAAVRGPRERRGLIGGWNLRGRRSILVRRRFLSLASVSATRTSGRA